jgi:hypothetical protein
MTSFRQPQPCKWDCPWKDTGMCAQCLLSSQALAERHLTLGVLCGLKQKYAAHGLPPCIIGDVIDWSGPHVEETSALAAT